MALQMNANRERMLEIVSEYEGIGVADIAAKSGVPRGTTGTNMNKMVDAGLVHVRWIALTGQWAALYYYGAGHNEPKPVEPPDECGYWVRMPPPKRNGLAQARRTYEPGNPFAGMIGQLTNGY